MFLIFRLYITFKQCSFFDINYWFDYLSSPTTKINFNDNLLLESSNKTTVRIISTNRP